jgi:chromosome segregation ATPase
MEQAEDGYSREEAQKAALVARLAELEEQKKEKQAHLDQKHEALAVTEKEPGRLQRQIASIESAKTEMQNDHRALLRRIKAFEQEQEAQAKRRADAEKLRASIMEKLELNRQTLEERELDVSAVAANLDKAKAVGHDLVTRRVELNVKKRDADNQLRHLNDQLMLANKDCDILKRQLKKKRVVADTARQNMPTLEENLKDQEALLRNVQDERSKRAKEIAKQKDEVDTHVARLLQQEGVEAEKKAVSFIMSLFAFPGWKRLFHYYFTLYPQLSVYRNSSKR